MRAQVSLKVGKLKVEVYGGYGEVGGNCIALLEGDRKIIFDNGLRFSMLKRFYAGRVEPLGPVELRSVSAIPPRELYGGLPRCT